ncbi:mannobiose 2-epimerase [Anaeromicropila populeti]|uniref:Cellobiose 2-epimerase n=1 Tax=Anaeromicropila populeti TaxID=37658 RepID=A0A1I6LM64_9FIRM|nr:mannobiose 2-epimerase [Anaeromicropila populeti]
MLIEQVKEHVISGILPFWSKLRDNENGGYYGLVDFNLNIDKTAPKGVILHSRILWFFANAYLMFGKKEYLEDARHAYEYIKNYCYDKVNGGVFWSTSYQGEVLDSTKHTYNMAFAIYALSSYYDASKEEEAIKLADEIYHVIEEKCCDSVGYLEAFDLKFQPVENDKLSENGVIAEKTMNTLLHVFEAYTEFYRVTKREEIKSRLEWMLDTFADKVFNPELNRQEVFFDKDMNSILDLHSYGHDIETAWLIDRGCEVLGERKYIEKLQPITKKLTQKIYETAYHKNSLWNECDRGEVDKKRIWWVQAEAVIGFLNGYEKEPQRTEYLNAAKNIWEYIKENVIDKRKNSEWFYELDNNGVPTENQKEIVGPWKCPYHNGRMCFEIIRRNIDV